jgi:hypothetical protein
MKRTLAMCKCRKKMLLCGTFVIVTVGELLERVSLVQFELKFSFQSFFQISCMFSSCGCFDVAFGFQ